ncbi:uncharacterized protein LOC129762557 [Toxorhynchites rutilus septentrionalis]|uniref:uncharacterized protein LOC129762557 n=1 Tax=Toxorhynchites rutilus septentrionalis TaxID=329112 RepID=UPI002479DF4F|nr:uncharacterized protein LOC129762557 [Toxorhynchites rutilus septentrionalis]
MAKTKWNLLFATFVLSGLSLATLIVSFCTQHWVVSEASEVTAYRNSEIHYGLFAGSLTRNVLATPVGLDLTVICMYEYNACVYSCQKDEAKREIELQDMMNGRKPAECPITSSHLQSKIIPSSVRYASPRAASKDAFIDASLWLTTVILLGIATAFAGASGSFSIINVMFNPVEPIFSVFGLYIWNAIVIISTLLTMIIWGALFGSSLVKNIAITDTLTPEAPYSSTGLAALGASYWLLFLPMLFHAVNTGLLLWRQYLINREPPPTTIDVDRSDLTIIMY